MRRYWVVGGSLGTSLNYAYAELSTLAMNVTAQAVLRAAHIIARPAWDTSTKSRTLKQSIILDRCRYDCDAHNLSHSMSQVMHGCVPKVFREAPSSWPQ